MNMRCLKFNARQNAKNSIYTALICNFCFRFTILSQKLFMHFFVTKWICAHFFLSRTRFTRFFAKTIYVHRPESFYALKVAIRKVQTFWASGLRGLHSFIIWPLRSTGVVKYFKKMGFSSWWHCWHLFFGHHQLSPPLLSGNLIWLLQMNQIWPLSLSQKNWYVLYSPGRYGLF